jgi:adenine-specific DNA-methyltransferase
MQNLLDNLKALLQKDERLVSEGEILKNKVMELALKLDKGLIELLLSDEKMKEVFFTQVGKATIFDKDKFIKFVSNKQFLPDSYTAFKNKIGLIDEKGEFISEKKEIVLSWPYKDCVLEGGMTKEDQKRDEIFWNEILASDEITRLLDPKVFTNAKRIDAKGEHKLDKFKTDENGDIKDNLIIKGNNLLVLHSLKKRFAGKVKLICIDPPYNTGGDANIFTYNNRFNHSTWLTFMKNRLEVSKTLLREDGILAITIDDFEQGYLKVLCDEIFGRDNFLGTVIIQSNPRGRTINSYFAVSHEYCYFYGKNVAKSRIGYFNLTEKQEALFNLKDKFGPYRLLPFRRSGGYSTPEERPNSYYPIYFDKKNNKFYLEKRPETIEILPIDQNGKKRVWRQTKPSFLEAVKRGDVICKKIKGKYVMYLKDRIKEGRKPKTIWIDSKYDASTHGTILLKELFGGERLFSYPKSIYTIIDIVRITTDSDKNDLVLDFFAGSGTTAHAVLELNKEDGGNRKFILVEQLEEHIKVCKERIQKVLQKEQIEEDFVFSELMKCNENFAEEIQQAKTKEELNKLWGTMKQKAFLSYKVDVKTIDAHAKEFDDLSIEDQKRFLLECLDKNHLYVNYSEIDDEEYGVSEEDKKVNNEFYEQK